MGGGGVDVLKDRFHCNVDHCNWKRRLKKSTMFELYTSH